MKKSFYRLGPAAILLAGMAFVGYLPQLPAQTKPTHRAEIASLDERVAAPKSPERLAQRNAGVNSLKQRLPVAEVSFDSLLDSPRFISSRKGFLTGPDGAGLAVPAAVARTYAANDVYRPVKAFLDANAELFGHNASALDNATVTRESVGSKNGMRTVVWQQQHTGLPVFEATLVGNLTARGELVTLSSRFLPSVEAAAGGVTPDQATFAATQAISAAMANLGDTVPVAEVKVGDAMGNGFQSFLINHRKAHGRLVWLPMNRINVRLAWELYVPNLRTRERFQVLVDAQSGAILRRQNLTRFISDATYNVYTSDSPSPFSPSLPSPATTQPPLVNRVMVTWPALDVTASPNGWINDGDNETRGNNTDTFLDRDFDAQPDGQRPQGNPTRVFDFPLDLTQDPVIYTNAAMVQMFYKVNYYHDALYQLGFTESAGNYQLDNFGRGGSGNDEIISYVQAGAAIGFNNNAFFSPAPDGINGEIAMFTWDFPTPDRDGDLDSEVIFHEATHGTSWRLVGGGMGLGNLQGDGMGEGWSDFYAESLLSEPGDDPDAAYANGGYPTYLLGGLNQNYYFGIRRYPYSTDLTKNPLTFKDIDPGQASPHSGVPMSPLYSPFSAASADEVHFQGEVWCSALWEVRANLIRKHGGAAGNNLALQLVTDGMKLTPASPTFLEARDAILLADQVASGGLNGAEIWAGFAKRGMGISAIAGDSDTTAGVVEAYDVPGLQIDDTILSGGNANGIIDVNECNQLDVVLKNNSPVLATGVSVQLSTTTRGVAFGSKVSDYPDIPSGATATNLVSFSLSTSPSFICGTPIVVRVLIKSDQVTSQSTLTFSSGTNGAPIRFDNSIPVAIPDNNLAGTNSSLLVSNITSAIGKVTVSMYLTHTWDADLTLQLISPDGVTNTLTRANGSSGDNYGGSCSPDTLRATFDDDAVSSVTTGIAPFVGSYRPQEPFTAFIGKSGTNINGTWKLRLVDDARLDVGVLQCWSLNLFPSQCLDGGGTCPGADLAVGISDAPDPVFVGSNLVYTITVTNLGPSGAKNTVVTHQLPPSVVFVSAVASQGTCVNAGGVVACSLGTVPFEGRVTIAVTVLPTTVGTISSSATITSSESDPDNGNNATITDTHVNPPTTELSIGLFDSPDPALVGSTLTYSVSVTNGGPSSASGVFVTNTLPPSVVVQSAGASQGSASIIGNIVVLNLGSLTNGARATGSINVTPTALGTIQATARVAANQTDPIIANNTATATTVVGPASDLILGITDTPDPVVVSSNWTYVLGITNLGPSTANNAVLNFTLPAGVGVKGTNVSQGNVSLAGSLVVANLGTLNAGNYATVTVLVNATNSGNYTAHASVASSAADPNSSNNSASASTTVAPPTVSIVAAGGTLLAESSAPANGAIDLGETVTLNLRLRNAGNVNNTNSLVATLLATNGVTLPSAPQNYGTLTPSGVPTGMPFSFTATGANGGTVSPTLQLQDGPNDLGLVAFTFVLPNTRSFSNTAAIVINSPTDTANPPAAASPYPSKIVVSGVTGLVGKVTVTLSNLNHTFVGDIDALLVSPTGQKVMLMSDAGDPNGVVNTTVTFDDAGEVLPDDGQIVSTVYAPADYEVGDLFAGPAPTGPYGTSLSAFNASNPNGEWSLYIVDDGTGDDGAVSGGWKLSLTTISPINQLADVSVAATVTPELPLLGGALTYTYTITNNGPDTATGIGFSDDLPAGLVLVSATVSQGSVVTNGNLVTATLDPLPIGTNAVVVVVAAPILNGNYTNSATVLASENDLNLANNSVVSKTTVGLPSADVGISQIAPASVALGGTAQFTLTVTNHGSQTALGVTVLDALPAGFAFVSAGSSTGSVTNAGDSVTANLGNLASGASATVAIVATAVGLGANTNQAVASTQSTDGNTANNSATAVVSVELPSPSIVPAGAVLTAEDFAPANLTIDNGEQVTVSFSLANAGSADTVNLVANLETSGGVTLPSGEQVYGALIRGGSSVARPFTFTATGGNGGIVTARLHLHDGATDLGTADFAFELPTVTTLVNTNLISIPDHGAATPYPSTINVAGLSGLVSKVTVTLNGLSHGFPDDLDLLLVGPAGQKVVIMSDSGGGHAVTNLSLVLDDASPALPDTTQILSGSYGPANYDAGDVFFSPAPGGAAGTALSLFNGDSANGPWSLYVVDDSNGDAGNISGGWALTITTVNPVTSVADLDVAISDAPDPVFVGNALVYTITVTNRGQIDAVGVTVSDTLPAGLAYVSSTASAGSVGANNSLVTANIGSLSPGGGAVITVRTAPSLGGVYTNTVTAAGSQADLNSVNNSATATTLVNIPQLAQFADVAVTNNQIEATLIGEAGITYIVFSSTDLTTWTPVSTNVQGVTGVSKFVDPNISGNSQRFYRAVRQIP